MSTPYIRIDSLEFQNRFSAILELFEDYKGKERYSIVETYEPIEVMPLEPKYVESFNLLPVRKKYLTAKEKKLIKKYLNNSVKNISSNMHIS